MMREFAVQGLQIVLMVIGFGAVAHVIFMVFAGHRPAPESQKATSFWSVLIQRSKGHVITLVLFALMIIVFVALGMLNKQHPMPLPR
jgi:hypothetical protein